jgi:uncharacterized protein YndB with AHSA1/START domain
VGEKISATVEIAAPPENVWALVSDLPRMGEWSPENAGGEWVGGATAAAVGAKFKGRNRNGKHKWSAAVRINEAEAPSRLSFTVVLVGPITGATWSYDIEPTSAGCRVTETWEDTVTRPIPVIGKVLTGVKDRQSFTKTSIDATLAGIKKTAESN